MNNKSFVLVAAAVILLAVFGIVYFRWHGMSQGIRETINAQSKKLASVNQERDKEKYGRECVECVSGMKDCLRSRDGTISAVNYFINFCSEHPDAMKSDHAVKVVQELHQIVGDEFQRICTTNKVLLWGIARPKKGDLIGTDIIKIRDSDLRELDGTFKALRELAGKVLSIKNQRAQKSCWYDFAKACMRELTRKNEAFALQYEVKKIEVKMDYGVVSDRFGALKIEDTFPVKMIDEDDGTWWKRTGSPLDISKESCRITANGVWQTVWENTNTVQTGGNPWRDAGIRLTVRDMGSFMGVERESASVSFVIPLYGDGASIRERIVERGVQMPLKEDSGSKNANVRVRVHVTESPVDDSPGNLFSLMPKNARLELP